MSNYKLIDEAYIYTSDQFYPNFEGDLVSVAVMRLYTEISTYRVCVWGMDDCGFERDWQSHNPEEARKVYDKIVASGDVTYKLLNNLGFKAA